MAKNIGFLDKSEMYRAVVSSDSKSGPMAYERLANSDNGRVAEGWLIPNHSEELQSLLHCIRVNIEPVDNFQVEDPLVPWCKRGQALVPVEGQSTGAIKCGARGVDAVRTPGVDRAAHVRKESGNVKQYRPPWTAKTGSKKRHVGHVQGREPAAECAALPGDGCIVLDGGDVHPELDKVNDQGENHRAGPSTEESVQVDVERGGESA